MSAPIFNNENDKFKILTFEGIKKKKPLTFGPFKQEGSLDGILISVTGADSTVHLQLQNGDLKYTNIDTDRATAKKIAQHLYDPLRLHGIGTWERNEDGNWNLKRFRLSGFDVLGTQDIRSAFHDLRKLSGSSWRELDDPILNAQKIRESEAEPS